MIGDNIDRRDGRLHAVRHRNPAPGYKRTRQNGWNIVQNEYRGMGAVGAPMAGATAGYGHHT